MIYTKEPSVRSESMVFNALKNNDHTMGWKVFYSLYVPKPGKDPFEIDFLVIIPKYFSVICLEVKGGPYEIKKGIWYPLDPSGKRRARLRKSPHDQVTDTMYALRNHCGTNKLKGFERREYLSLGCAVAFTDLSEPSPLPNHLTNHLAHSIWSSDVQNGDKLRKKLEEIAENMCKRRGPRNEKEEEKADIYLAKLQANLDPGSILNLKNRIFSSDLVTLRKELLVPTNDQLRSLELVNDNDCCVITGAAGTGKTVLAMDLAKQRCEKNGKKVALLCSNPYLSSRFERWSRTLSNDSGGKVVAGTLAEFSAFGSKKQGKFDYLIVDEAQNLCDKKSRSLMDRFLNGKLTNGCWAMFGDFTHQHISNPDVTKTTKKGEEVLAELQEIYPRMTLGRLKINCRNTYEIAAAFSMFLGIDSLPRSGVHGPLIQTKYFKTQEDLNDLLDDLVTDFKDREFFSRQIILLSSSSDDFNTVSQRQYGGWKLLNVRESHGEKNLDKEQVPDVSGDSSKRTLRYSDIHDFQGLESEVVILVIPFTGKQVVVGGSATLPHYDHLRKVLYTGMSRAKAILVIVADESYKEHLDLKPLFRKSYTDRIEKLSTQQLSESIS
jgi:hypothetical protein